MALSYLWAGVWGGFLSANGLARKAREVSHWDSSFYSTNNYLGTRHVPGTVLDPRNNATISKKDKFLEHSEWPRNGYCFPALFCLFVLLYPHPDFFFSPSCITRAPWPALYWFLSLGHFATASQSSGACKVFSFIPQPLTALEVRGYDLFLFGARMMPASRKCSINNKLKKILAFYKQGPTTSEALQKSALSPLPALFPEGQKI